MGLLSPFVTLQAFAQDIKKVIKSNKEWKELLTNDQYYILRQEGTEPPFTSALNDEKREVNIFVLDARHHYSAVK